MSSWSAFDIEFLESNYPQRGASWCAEALGRSIQSVRNKAWRFAINALPGNDARQRQAKNHSKELTGRKRPGQSLVMKRLNDEGRLKKTTDQCAAIGMRMKIWIKENGHPRGALGYKHTEESKAVMSKKAKATAASKTDDQWLARTKKSLTTKGINGTILSAVKMGSWKAAWREIGGIRNFYRSKWEANYARYLQWLMECGQIYDWAHEPELFWFDGIKRGSVSYLPDFRVIENDGSKTYHEVKGWMDDRSATKIKRMAKYHPDVKLIVVDGPAYNAIKKSMSSIILDWE